ncbi:MAG: TetR/AcrR family transcriptional regulator [Novosphingobium sp.]|nr:TetR/AcrR family transcriptional regulator [Novosphingobium sp.]
MSTQPLPARDRRPPERKSDRTRAAILDAASRAFSAHGYSATGVREITAAAGVNPALVSRYFGSKEKLFEAVLDAALDVELLTRHNRATFGRDLVAMFSGDGSGVHPLPLLVLATGDPAAREIADRILRDRVIGPLTRWFGGAEAESRAARLLLVSAGFYIYRQLYPLDCLSGALDPAMRSWLEGEFQSLVE